MSPDLDRLRLAFDAQLVNGLEDPVPPFTRRRVFGQVRLPGKVTSVIGMRRAGKTTFLHQLRELPPDPAVATEGEVTRLESTFRKWLATGGFPEAQGLPLAPRLQLLRDYVDVAILRDVIDRYAVRNVTGLRWLARHVLASAASLFSVEKFHARLKAQAIAISRDTVHEYLACLEDCFLVRTVWIEADSERQRMVNPRKAYPVDAGLIAAFDRSGRANPGHALETAVLIELERRGCEVTYVRTPEGYEVDFLARSPRGDAELIQVCVDASDHHTASRKLRALTDTEQRFPNARKRLLTLTRSGLPSETPGGIEVQPACEWFLGESPPLPEPAPAGWL